MQLLWLRRIKRRIISALFKPHVQIQVRGGVKRRIGNDYGCFFVFPDKLRPNPVVYSFGVGEDASFDLGMIRQFGAKVYAFDPTPKSVQWVDRQHMPKAYRFYPYGLSDKDGEETLYLPVNPDYVSASVFHHADVDGGRSVKVPMKTLKAIAESLGHNYIDVLKMDIEGSEFKAINSILESGLTFGQICIEIHYYYFQDGKKKLLNFIRKMNAKGYYLAAKMENMEVFTFISK